MSQPNPDDFERHYREHAGPLLAFLTARVRPRTDAADVAQEVWKRVWKKFSTFDGGNFRPWLFTIARNLLIDRGRRPRREAMPAEYDTTDPRAPRPADRLIDRERQQRLEHCLGHLDETERRLVRGRLAGENYETLSAGLGLTTAQAYQLLHHAKTRLQECVGRDEP